MSRGRFITFEGIEGSGKSTQIRILAHRLVESGQKIDVTREPGGTELGEAIRALLLADDGAEANPRAQALLHSAARAEHVAKRIAPALDAGVHVLCDRFYDSTLAYQGGGLGLPVSELLELQKFAIQSCEPDLRVLLVLDPPECIATRLSTRHERNWIDEADIAFHSRVQAIFQERAREYPAQWLEVDGQLPIDDVSSIIRDEVRDRFPEFATL